MKVKWSLIVDQMKGDFGNNMYVRAIPGDNEWASVCRKPELSKKTKKKKAALSVSTDFSRMIAASKEILRTPERRAVWQARYDEAKRIARKHNKPIQGRLCDYVLHEVSLALQNGEAID